MNEEMIERRRQGARSRNQTFLVTYQRWDHDELLEFLEEYKTDWEMDAGGRYWFFHFDFTMTKIEDLWPEETKLERTRRLRNNKKWEGWR